jgi:hypothetical protein
LPARVSEAMNILHPGSAGFKPVRRRRSPGAASYSTLTERQEFRLAGNILQRLSSW